VYCFVDIGNGQAPDNTNKTIGVGSRATPACFSIVANGRMAYNLRTPGLACDVIGL
jgi:hypothetical protein